MNKLDSKPKTWAEWDDWLEHGFREDVKSLTIKGKERTRLIKILKSRGGLGKIIS